jgi:hypothetical protein
MVDTLGLLLTVVVHSADIQDRDGAKLLVERLKCYLPRLHLVFADGGYAGCLVDWFHETVRWTLSIVKRPPSRRQALWSCPSAGSSNGRLPGSGNIAGTAAITRNYPKPARP